jgi:hypothetical protein
MLHAEIPKGVRVRLEFEKSQFQLGESILAHYVIDNTGDKPFKFSFGGDYRGPGRPNRFHVAATDDAGKPVPDPLRFDVSRWPVREAAVRALPTPLSEQWAPKLRAALNDADYGVVKAACEVAGASGHKEFAEPLVEIVAAEQNPRLLDAAAGAAEKLGAGIELTEAWIGQLAHSATWNTAFHHLIDRVCKDPAS